MFLLAAIPLLVALVWPAAVRGEFRCAGYNWQTPAAKLARSAETNAVQAEVISSRSTLNTLVVFAQFAGEQAGHQEVPNYALDLFDAQRPGSFTHFYQTMSFGRLLVSGEALLRRYSARQSAKTYLSADPTRVGEYGRFAREVLRAADQEVDFGRFDNDGPDGVPNSGDDDGYVDYIFLNLRSVPANFLLGPATGTAGLGFEEYQTKDRNPQGAPIRIAGGRRWGTVLQEGTFAQTVGVMAHEFGHSLGLPDLYDTSFLQDPDQDPAADGAGIGRWGLMGLGALGWNGNDGPVGFSAWSLARLGWIGAEDGRLLAVEQASEQLEIADIYQGGTVYQVLLRQTSSDNVNVKKEHLLLEQRVRKAHYYNRNLPAEGLLVWHVREGGGGNATEQKKLLDLVCADGLYADRGYPLGQVADPLSGGDNLDFWAHDPVYRETHAGNMGDATDIFDGVRFTRFDDSTNPSTNSTGQPLSGAQTGVALRNIQRQGDRMLVDVEPARWAGVIREQVQWVGDILIDGDLTVAPEGRVMVQRNARIRVAGRDRLATGVDPQLCEIRIQGDFILPFYVGANRQPIPFEALVEGEAWYGLIVDPGLDSRIELPERNFAVRDAVAGIVLAGVPDGAFGIVADGFRLLDTASTQRAGNGDGQPGPGEAFQLEVQVSNWTLATHGQVWVEVRWEGDLLRPTWPQATPASILRSEPFRLPSGAQGKVVLPSLTLGSGARPGQRVDLEIVVKEEISSSRMGRRLGGGTASWTVQGEYADYPLEVTTPGHQIIDGTVLLDPNRPIQVQVATEAQAVDLVVHTLPDLEPVAEQAMQRPGPLAINAAFTTDFRASQRGQYLLSFRVRGPQGAAFSPTTLQAVSLVEAWHPVLVLVDDPNLRRPKPALLDAFARPLAALGLDYTWLDMADTAVDRRLLITPLLNRYLAEGHVVVWLGGRMDASTQTAFRHFLQQGGRLLLSSVRMRVVPGIEAFFADMLHMSTPQKTTATKVRFVEGVSPDPIDLFTYHAVVELWPPAQPLLVDANGYTAGLRLDTDGYKVVYLPFSLANIEAQDLRRLLDTALNYLYSAPVARAELQVEGLVQLEDQVNLDPLIPRVVVVNAGKGDSEAFRLQYQVLEEGRVLFTVALDQEPLGAQQEREVALPAWTPTGEGQVQLRVGVAAGGRDTFAYQVVRALRVVDGGRPFVLEELPVATDQGNGVGFFDVDGDGDLDLFLVRKGVADQLFGNQQAGFREIAAAAGVDHSGEGRGLAVGDVDGDSDLDLYVTNKGPNQFYLNNGDGIFVEAAGTLDADGSATHLLSDEGAGRSAVFFDYDNDGDLDLYVANARGTNRLFTNRGGRFDEMAAAAGLADDGNSRGVAVGDYDGDGDQDLYVANLVLNRPSQLYRNQGPWPGGHFKAVGAAVGLTYQSGEVGAAWADYDNDGDLDLMVGNQATANRLYRNDGGRFSPTGADLGGQSVGLAWLDYDNDGDLDVATTALEPQAGGDQLFQNSGGNFVSSGLSLGLRSKSDGRGLAYGDYDGDGDLDLFVADEAGSLLYRNKGAKRHWVRLELQGTQANRQALGARLEVWAQGRVQFRQVAPGYGYCSQTDARQHVGLDRANGIDSVLVFWPDGSRSAHRDMPVDALLQLAHPLHRTAVQTAGSQGSRDFALEQNYPNPFNSGTVIRFALPQSQVVELAVYNLAGQQVIKLVDGFHPGGTYTVHWDGRDAYLRELASGIYLYRLQAGTRLETRKLLLLR